MHKIALVVHGGAGNIPRNGADVYGRGIERALERGWTILESGGSSLDACEQAIIALEDEPVFDAGIGSHLNRDGRVQLDAILMDGSTLKSGAVAAVERLRNPVRLARLILERSPHMLIAGSGAEQFAAEHGLPFCEPSELITPRAREVWSAHAGGVEHSGTVGAVALDAAANIAAGTSTGGTAYKYPGRVGDSPLVGCGCYADNLAGGGVSTTGEGEAIMKVVLAKTVTDLIAAGHSAQAAADAAIALLSKRTSGKAGLIVLDRAGMVGAAYSTPHMAYGFRTWAETPVIRV